LYLPFARLHQRLQLLYRLVLLLKLCPQLLNLVVAAVWLILLWLWLERWGVEKELDLLGHTMRKEFQRGVKKFLLVCL
jgi:hypothetical protein